MLCVSRALFTRSRFAVLLALALTACSDGGPSSDAGPDALDARPDRDSGPVGGSCVTGCTGFSYCDPFSDTCRPGCGDDTACGAQEFCELTGRTCVCRASAHACGDVCVDSASPATCGDRCAPCPTVSNGDATCSAGSCGIACRSGFEACGSACVSCPTAGVVATGCSGSTCIATACEAGYVPCASGCCTWEHAVITGLTGSGGSTLRLAAVGSEVHGLVDAEFRPTYFRGARSSWAVESVPGEDFDLTTPFTIVGPGPRIAATASDALVSLIDSGASWTQTTAPPLAGVTDLRAISCATAPTGTTCLSTNGHVGRLLQLSASGAWSMGTPTAENYGAAYSLSGSALALDAAGGVHMAFITVRQLQYRRTFATDDPSGHDVTAGELSSVRIVTDSTSSPHILVDGDSIVHVFRRGGAWQRATVARSDTYLTSALGLQIDSADHLHAAWSSSDGLHYGFYDGTSWTTSLLDAREPIATDLVLLAGKPHIVATFSVSATVRSYESFWLP